MGTLTAPTIVLGMHRSGTSMLTGTLEQAGLFLGDVNIAAPHNKKGNRENEKLRRYHSRIIKRRGGDWKTPPELPIQFSPRERQELAELLKPFEDVERWGFKDPRAIWLVEVYLELFPDATLIGIFRHPFSVAKSLAARPGKLTLPIEEGLALWQQTNERLLRLCQQHQFPLLYFSTTGITDPMFSVPLSKFLNGIGLSNPVTPFFEQHLVHQASNDQILPHEVNDLYQELLATARSQHAA
ncbi:MAG: sulfotransferase [Pseudomonadota bacterium]